MENTRDTRPDGGTGRDRQLGEGLSPTRKEVVGDRYLGQGGRTTTEVCHEDKDHEFSEKNNV